MMASIIIPTFQRAGLLKLGLQSLRWQETAFEHEIIVVNDGLEGEGTKDVCEQYGARYIFSGSRNANGLKPRCPGFAINIGAKFAQGDVVVLTCPEMFHPGTDSLEKVLVPLANGARCLTTPSLVLDDLAGSVLAKVSSGTLDAAAWQAEKLAFEKAMLNGGPFMAHPDMPFFMGMRKSAFLEIGGYDEDFTGIAADDNDLVERLAMHGNPYVRVDAEVVHLFHGVKNYDMSAPAYQHNVNLWKYRRGLIQRNVGWEWGKL